MGFFSDLFWPGGRQQRDVIVSEELMRTLRAQHRGAIGPMTPEAALRQAAVYTCLKIIAETMGQMPLHLYKKLDRGQAKAEEHPLYWLLYQEPNNELSSAELIMLVAGHAAGWGNGVSQKVMSRGGKLLELWPFEPSKVTIRRSRQDDEIYYDYEGESFHRSEIFHVRGWGFDGIQGHSVLSLLRRKFEQNAASEEYALRFYSNGARPGGVLEHPGVMSQPKFERFRKQWEETHQGVDNSHKVAILENGMKYHPIGIPPKDAQFVESDKITRSQIFGAFRVPPHLGGDLEKATFSNIEQQALEFVKFTLGPWIRLFEQAITRDLIQKPEKRTHYAKFNVDGLLRGDFLTRIQGHNLAIQSGVETPNEAREKEELPPKEGGDSLLLPLNMQVVGGNNGA